jgi:hypothetical protein
VSIGTERDVRFLHVFAKRLKDTSQASMIQLLAKPKKSIGRAMLEESYSTQNRISDLTRAMNMAVDVLFGIARNAIGTRASRCARRIPFLMFVRLAYTG